jgi:hemoglobin-like flavoprotein
MNKVVNNAVQKIIPRKLEEQVLKAWSIAYSMGSD